MTAPRKTTARRYPPHLLARLRTLRRRMKRASVEAMLITCPADIRYLTDFAGDDSWLLVTGRQAYVISDFRFQEQIDRTSPFVTAIMRTEAMTKTAAGLIGDHKLRRIAFQAEHLSVQLHQTLGKVIGERKWKATTGWLLEQRAIKDDHEQRAIRRAIRIQQAAFEQWRAQLRVGMTERQAVAILEHHMRDAGGEGPSFPTIVAVGPNSSLPHAVPGDAKVRRRQPILIDFGTVWGGYCSDLTRVLSIGPMSRDLREVYEVVLEAQQAAIGAIVPGVKLKDVDAVARKIICDAGHGERFGHGLGHGIGLDIHEQPTLSGRSEGTLAPGHVVTVEPGIYLPGIGGVRIEDDVLVTGNGRRRLSSLKRTVESAMI